MAKKGDMLYAWTNDAEIKKQAELGGAVTALWKHALESKTVDAVFAIRKGTDIYDAQPVFITDPKDLAQTAGSLHCGTLLLPKLVKKYLDGAANKKIGVTVKGCDVMGFIELANRKQINLNNIVMIGVNCGGSVSPILARKMIADKFGVDPDTVHKEEIDKGQFIIEYEGGHKGISIDELEEAGYGRRSNCRRSRSPGRPGRCRRSATRSPRSRSASSSSGSRRCSPRRRCACCAPARPRSRSARHS